MATEAKYQCLNVDLVQDGLALRIELNSPKGNILSMAMMAEIQHALSEFRDDQDLHMVLLCAAGKNFSFGASVEEHRRELAPTMLANFHAFIRELATYPIPLVSLVNGACLGGAFEMVLATQIVFATNSAHFACPEIQLGVFPPVLAAIGPLRLGGAWSDQLLLTGAKLSVEQARQIGFVRDVFPAEKAEEALWAWFDEEMAGRSAFALRQASYAARLGSGLLSAVKEPLDALEKHYVNIVVPSADGGEGIEAFIERRKPKWENR